MYGNFDCAAKSTYVFIFSVVKAELPSGSRLPLHQSQAASPGCIQLVSSILEGGLRLVSSVDSIRRPGRSPTSSTRHGEVWGRVPLTSTSGSSPTETLLSNW